MAKPLDISKSFTYPFEQADWQKKFLFGGAAVLLAPVLVGALALLGYGRAVFLAARDGRDELPSWDRAGDYIADGVQGFIVVFAYTIPLWVAAVGTAVLSLAAQSLPGGVPGVLAFWCTAPFGFVVLMLVAFVAPVALARFYESGKMASAFEFQAIVDFLRANAAAYVPIFAVALLTGFVTSSLMTTGWPLAMFLIGLPILACAGFVGFLGWVAMVHALGKLRSEAKGAAPVSLSTEEPPAPSAGV